MASSPYRVSIRTEEAQRGTLSQRWVRDVVRRALAAEDAPSGGRVEVLIAGDETVSALNAGFLAEQGVTDVLSFPAGGDSGDDDDAWPQETGESGGDIGQIVLSAPQVARQAEAAGMIAPDEAAHLLVHATLHLLGHDHETGEDEEAMRAREDAILLDIIGRPVHGTESMTLSHTADSRPSVTGERGAAHSAPGWAP